MPELGAKGPADADVVRVMSFNLRNSEFDREEIVPQLIADYMPDSAGLQAKINGIDLILEKAATFDMPVVLIGDFNFGKGTALYIQLNSGCVKDSAFLAEKADSGATSHDYQENIEAEAVDIICVSSKVQNVKSYNIIREKYNGRFVSDHYPIYSDIVM